MKKVFKARDFKIPSNLPEILDERTGEKPGTFRNMMADGGTLRETEQYALATVMGKTMKAIMEADGLPDKRMSYERMNNALWALMFAYCLGTLQIDEDGDIVLGSIQDISFVTQILDADVIKFRTGKTMDAEEFMRYLQGNTSNIENVYRDVVERKLVGKRINSVNYFKLALVAIRTSDKLMAK